MSWIQEEDLKRLAAKDVQDALDRAGMKYNPLSGVDEPVKVLPETILQEAQRIVDGDREKTYGHPAANFERTAVLWSVVFGHPVTVRQVALAMVCLKLAREVHEPKRDNLTDACGYLRCIEKAANVGFDVDKPLGTGV